MDAAIQQSGAGGVIGVVERVGVVILLLAALGANPASASANGAHASVVGGTPAPISQFPFMARIVTHEPGGEGICSGTVVSSNVVLTAAHCLYENGEFVPPEDVEIVTGTNIAGGGGVVSAAEELIIDPSYIESGLFFSWHDAGLIVLAAPISATPVKIATAPWPAGTGAAVVGWGATDPSGEGPATPVMQQGRTVVQKATYCQRAIGSAFHPAAEICSVDYPTYQSATCYGDSGGPMLAVQNGEYVEIGITDWNTEGACTTEAPRVDTRVDVEYRWIVREIESHAPRLPTLSTGEAKHDTFNVLRTDGRLRRHFSGHGGYKVSCSRSSRTSARCYPSWWRGPRDYWGQVRISLAWDGPEAYWYYGYNIRSVNDYCYWYSGHRGRCPIQEIHG